MIGSPPSTFQNPKLTLKVQANSLPQLFELVAHELLKALIDPQEVGQTLREKVVVEASDLSALLKEWVTTLLSLTRDQHILFGLNRFQEFKSEGPGSLRLRAEITGELIDPSRHVFRNELAHLRCGEVRLLNNSKTIEAEVILVSEKNKS